MPVIENRLSSNHQVKIGSSELLMGMFVCELDCAWSITPFPMGGFHIKQAEDIETLQKYCKIVSIDTNRGALPKKQKSDRLTILSSARRASPNAAKLKVNRDAYPAVSRSIKQELDSACKHYCSLQFAFLHITRAIREGDNPNFKRLAKPVERVIDAIIANPQTLVWILNTDPSKPHHASYCARAAIWATILARQIGMKRPELKILFLGTLLADMGMHLLPERLVNKRGFLRRKEFLAYCRHIEFGLEILSQHDELDDKIGSIIRSHHERHDGKGFPKGLRGEQIPTLARFANLAYCFERLLKTNSPGKEISPAKALAALYEQRLLKFPEQLIMEFIQMMGMYPVGSVVKLTSGEFALVLEQNPEEKLFPKIAIITDKARARLERPRILHLAAQEQSNKRVTIATSPKLHQPGLPTSTRGMCGGWSG